MSPRLNGTFFVLSVGTTSQLSSPNIYNKLFFAPSQEFNDIATSFYTHTNEDVSIRTISERQRSNQTDENPKVRVAIDQAAVNGTPTENKAFFPRDGNGKNVFTKTRLSHDDVVAKYDCNLLRNRTSVSKH